MNNLKRLGLVGLLGAGAVFGSGCKGMTDNELATLGFMGDLAGVSPASDAAQAATGYAVGRAADRESGRREAREGKTEVNVYGGVVEGIPEHVIIHKIENGEKYYKPEEGYEWNNPKDLYAGVRRVEEKEIDKMPRIFFCNGYFDDNNDGYWLPSEYKNIKEVFNDYESIEAVSIWDVVNGDLNGKAVTLDIFGIDTGKTAYDFGILKVDPDNIIRSSSDYWATHYLIPVKDLKDLVGGTKFRAIWNLDGEPKKYAEFVVVDSRK